MYLYFLISEMKRRLIHGLQEQTPAGALCQSVCYIITMEKHRVV